MIKKKTTWALGKVKEIIHYGSINSPETTGEEQEDKVDGTLSFWGVFKLISSISIPTALSYTFVFEMFLIVALMNYMNESEDEIAAGGLITLLMNSLIIVGFSPLFAMNVLASKKLGELAKAQTDGEGEEQLALKREYIAGINRNGFLLSMGLSVPVMAGLFFSKPILTHVFHQDEEVAELAQHFLRIYAPSVPAMNARIAAEQMLLSFKRAKQVMALGLPNLVVFTGLAIKLGNSEGIALAYLAETYATAIAYCLYLGLHPDFKEFEFFKIFKKFEGQGKQFLEFLSLGSSISLSVASEVALALSTGLLAGALGPKEQSAMAFVNQAIFFNFLLVSSFGITTGQELNRQIGSKNYENASRIGKYGLLSTLIYTIPVPLVFSIAPNLLIISDADQSAIEAEAVLKYLAPMILVGNMIDSARYNLMQQARPLKDIQIPTFISAAALSLGITASAFLGLKTPLGIYGIALGYTGSLIVVTPSLLCRWKTRIQAAKIQEVNERPAVPSLNTGCFCARFIMRFFKQIPKHASQDEEQKRLIGDSVSDKKQDLGV